jgi:hypothetical protein
MNTNEQDQTAQDLRMFEAEAQSQAFEHTYNSTSYTRDVNGGAYFWGNMWDSPEPGAYMRYWSWIGNDSFVLRAQLTITAFVGPGCLFDEAVDGLAVRDQGWPMLSSKSFQANPGRRVKVEMGHRLPTAMTPGGYILNLLLWESTLYNKPAKLWDRMHLRFSVK